MLEEKYVPFFHYNKYSRWYFDIIEKAKNENRQKYQGIYYEKHHIIPRCFDGGEELVLLTCREHFICHRLLVKMVKTKKHFYQMVNAITRFAHSSKRHARILSSYQYEIVKQHNILFGSQKKTEETKLKISLSNKGKRKSESQKKNHSELMKKKFLDPNYVKRHSIVNSKKICINNVVYNSSKEASICLKTTPQSICYRLRSENFPHYRYIGDVS